MKKSIELFNSTTGWTATAGVVLADNDHPQYIADNTTKSLQVAFPAGGGSITKDLALTPIDITGYEEITFHFMTFDGHIPQFITNGTFHYKLDLGTGVVFDIPVEKGFCPVTVYVGGMTSITQIKISSDMVTADTIILSAMVASKDELPLDIFSSIKSALQTFLDSKLSFMLGTIAAAAVGDKEVVVVSSQWLEANCVIKITSGGNTEYHHVRDFVNNVLTFSTLYDGTTIKYDHTDAVVSFFIPVTYGTDTEIILPGITLWEDDEVVTEPRNKENFIYDTRTASGIKVRRQGRYTTYSILLDLEAWQTQVMKETKHFLRNWLERSDLWVNGKLFHLITGDEVVVAMTSRVEGIDVVPKTQYTVKIQIGVNIWDRETLVNATSTTATVVPELSRT